MTIVLTCEHGGNKIPYIYKYLFADAREILKTHRGFDLGALDLFKHLREVSDFSHSCTISRLLIELNRSLQHPQLFSEFTATLSLAEKRKLIDTYYLPYREYIEKKIVGFVSNGNKVLHISVHSFTPVMNDQVRTADIGILYDPARSEEKGIAKDLRKLIIEQLPQLRVRYNYPYLGKADGFTTSLRKKFPNNYSGIEFEINQKLATANKMDDRIKEILYSSILKLKKLTV